MLLLDLSHTSHTRARTGIQRVTRAIFRELGPQAVTLCYDPYAAAWREIEPWEHANLVATSGAPGKRRARWPFVAKVRGKVRQWSGHRPSLATSHGSVTGGLLVPEIFSPSVAGALPELLAATKGPRVAVFHDAIALKYPELTPATTVARFPAYLRELLAFDGVAATSVDTQQSLIDYWSWLGEVDHPPVQSIPLGIEPIDALPTDAVAPPTAAKNPVVLSVGSIEGRKNHLALLKACEELWSSGATFELRLIGLAQSQTGQAALQQIKSMHAAGRPVRYDGPVDDAALHAAYAECSFTVYPSLIEGFGLPVLESLARVKPCICSSQGALGEAARGGGCLMLDRVDSSALKEAIRSLLDSPARCEQLIAEAKQRPFRSWGNYASDLVAWMQALTRRPG